MYKKVLVYGYYNKNNKGDDFFIEAFKSLFPSYKLIFTDHINDLHLTDIDAVFFGGGSFLFDAPEITVTAFQLLKSKKIFYIGIGVEPEIHPNHIELMSIAKFIAIRSTDQIDRIKQINKNVLLIPDLVYSLQDKIELSNLKTRSVLILTNSNVLPQRSDPHWKHAAWNYFKSEFSQFLDWLIENNYNIDFFSLCKSKNMDDQWAACELISFMNNRNNDFILNTTAHKINEVSKIISQYGLVITQRFHGIVLSEMTKTPFIAIHHHDKLKSKNEQDNYLSYYGLSKHSLVNAFKSSFKMKYTNVLPLKYNIFETLINEVDRLI